MSNGPKLHDLALGIRETSTRALKSIDGDGKTVKPSAIEGHRRRRKINDT